MTDPDDIRAWQRLDDRTTTSGRIVADGPPAETLTANRMRDIYGVAARIDGTSVHIEGAA